jgi:hypothetical protein
MSHIPSPYGDEILYYKQVDAIKEVNQGKSRNWCEVRPDAIIGKLVKPYILQL